MDVDFHYHATYVAARFAGYNHNRAVTIATSAQMIDENNAHTIFKELSSGVVGASFKGQTSTNRLMDMDVIDIYENSTIDAKLLLNYECIESFQLPPSAGTVMSTRYVQAVWAAFHFLPGNFEVNYIIDLSLISPLWKRRTGELDKDHDFQWMCRPHSPMAISLIRNCAEKVRQKEITDHGLEDYLTGITAHVFADTFAHQDFTHAQSKAVNGIHHLDKKFTKRFQWRSLQDFTKLPLDNDLSIYQVESNLNYTSWTDDQWKMFVGAAPNVSADMFNIGHGQVGHIPDNSSLIFKYHPTWSSEPIIRNNPIVYLDAFVHLVWALHCIRTGDDIYEPFEVNRTSLNEKYSKINSNFNEENLTEVWKVLCKPRDPFGNEGKSPDSGISDQWDRSIYLHGSAWFDLINRLGFGGREAGDKTLEPWLPGKSNWVLDVRTAFRNNMDLSDEKVYKKRNSKSNRPWLTAAQFETLDFFKFNVAVKHHYRFVKEQLGYFKQPFTEHWAGDGHCYVNDFSTNKLLKGNSENPLLVQFLIDLRSLIFKLEETQKGTRFSNDTLKRGLGRLVDDVCALNSDAEASIFIRKLSQALHNPSSNAEFIDKYGLFDEKGEPIDGERLTKWKIKGLFKHWTESKPDEIASHVLSNLLTDDYIKGFNISTESSSLNEPTNTFEQPNPQTQGGRKQPGGIRR